jgi:DNA repair protein RadB
MKTPTGSKILDNMLNSGYDKDIITTIYGPAGSGKTCLCMLCCAKIAREGKKVIFIDTEGGFSVDRFSQIAPDYQKLLKNIIFLKPTSFIGQIKVFDKLRKKIDDKVGVIIVDTIGMLYRVELGKTDKVYHVNRALGEQIAYLTEIARTKNIPVLITNQVYADFEKKDEIKIVGGDILKYGSKCLIELKITDKGNRKAILRKHRSIRQKEIVFKIVQGGIIGTKEQ